MVDRKITGLEVAGSSPVTITFCQKNTQHQSTSLHSDRFIRKDNYFEGNIILIVVYTLLLCILYSSMLFFDCIYFCPLITNTNYKIIIFYLNIQVSFINLFINKDKLFIYILLLLKIL